MRQISVHWSKDKTENSFIIVNSEGRNIVQEVESSVYGFSWKYRVCERLLLAMAARLWL